MKYRPYMTKSFRELKSLAEENRDEFSTLTLIRHELDHRTTQWSKDFLAEVKKRIATLEEDAAKKKRAYDSLVQNLKNELAAARGEVARLSTTLAKAEREMAEARDQARSAEARAKKAEERARHNPSTKLNGALYAKVGLDPDCDDVVVDAVRTALRKQWHPDTKPSATDSERRAMTARFQENERTFEAILQLRRSRAT